jgi:hypothetical protein
VQRLCQQENDASGLHISVGSFIHITPVARVWRRRVMPRSNFFGPVRNRVITQIQTIPDPSPRQLAVSLPGDTPCYAAITR